MVSHDGHSENLSMSTVFSFLEGVTLMCQSVSIASNTKDTELMLTCFLSKDELFLPLIGTRPHQVPLNSARSFSAFNLASTPCLLGVEVFILNVRRIAVRYSNSERRLLGIVSGYCLDAFKSGLLSMSFLPHLSP